MNRATGAGTRRVLLDAAARVVADQGTRASLDAVVQEAGVSKGALLYHFATKELLLEAMHDDLLEQVRRRAHDAVDVRDPRPGRTVRGYVTAVFDLLDQRRREPEAVDVLRALAAMPRGTERGRRDSEYWDAAIGADGLDPHRAALILRAARGTAWTAMDEGPSARDLAELRRTLVRMSHEATPR